MKKVKSSELITILISTIVTILVAVGGLRLYAPQLLGISSDLRMVKIAKEVPPFFDNVFRLSDYKSEDLIIPDPVIKRSIPFYPDLGGYGPNDLLGFRNRNIPNSADVIIIGDSQTYGNNSTLELNWPNMFIRQLKKKNKYISHYDLASGGWSAIEYLEIFYKSLVFRPRMVVIAFYTGNDPLGSFAMAYSNKRWMKYRSDHSLSSSDLPNVEYPPPSSDRWEVKFSDKVSTVFSPRYRLYSNEKNKVVKAGYDAMLLVAQEVADICLENNISVIYTVIPTKELVYKKKIDAEADELPIDYIKLVKQEKEYIDWFGGELEKIENVQYINIVEAMQDMALQPIAMYPDDVNGHPLPRGYKTIADHLAKNVELNWASPEGLVALFTEDSKYQLGLVRDGNYWTYSHQDVIEANGWDSNVIPKSIRLRDIANFPNRGVITYVDKEKFGPK